MKITSEKSPYNIEANKINVVLHERWVYEAKDNMIEKIRNAMEGSRDEMIFVMSNH